VVAGGWRQGLAPGYFVTRVLGNLVVGTPASCRDGHNLRDVLSKTPTRSMTLTGGTQPVQPERRGLCVSADWRRYSVSQGNAVKIQRSGSGSFRQGSAPAPRANRKMARAALAGLPENHESGRRKQGRSVGDGGYSRHGTVYEMAHQGASLSARPAFG
jgi:hypothetical protein